MINDSETYRRMGDYIMRHGFSPRYYSFNSRRPKSGNFIHALDYATKYTDLSDSYRKLLYVLGINFLGPENIRAAGWREDAASTRDAAAACYMAADLAAEDERSRI